MRNEVQKRSSTEENHRSNNNRTYVRLVDFSGAMNDNRVHAVALPVRVEYLIKALAWCVLGAEELFL
jgi:hypothetical protein